jgi:hypothetical protein
MFKNGHFDQLLSNFSIFLFIHEHIQEFSISYSPENEITLIKPQLQVGWKL